MTLEFVVSGCRTPRAVAAYLLTLSAERTSAVSRVFRARNGSRQPRSFEPITTGREMTSPLTLTYTAKLKCG